MDERSKGLLSRVVRYARVRRGIDQETLARRMGSHQPFISQVECGKPLLEATVERIAAALGSTFEELVFEYLDAKRALVSPDEHLDVREQRRAASPIVPPEEYEPPGPSRERQLRRLWERCGGNKVAMARVLSVTHASIRQQLRKYGIGVEPVSAPTTEGK